MEIEADLHLHSNHSDGVYSPGEVVARAVAAGLRAISLTDHDTVDGVQEAIDAAPSGLEVIPGAELSCAFRGREIHVLVHYIDHTDDELRNRLEPLRQDRRLRAERMVARLRQIGIPITMDEVLEVAQGAGARHGISLGRPHVAEVLVRHGAANDVDDAFRRYLRKGQPAYVPKPCMPLGEAVRLAKEKGGVAVIAHPALNLAEADTLALAGEGLAGIEVRHPKHTDEQRVRLDGLARQLGLISSGGSDYHGPGRSRHEIGAAGVSLDTVRLLRGSSGRSV
jgi:hypothetical protein